MKRAAEDISLDAFVRKSVDLGLLDLVRDIIRVQQAWSETLAPSTEDSELRDKCLGLPPLPRRVEP